MFRDFVGRRSGPDNRTPAPPAAAVRLVPAAPAATAPQPDTALRARPVIFGRHAPCAVTTHAWLESAPMIQLQ